MLLKNMHISYDNYITIYVDTIKTRDPFYKKNQL